MFSVSEYMPPTGFLHCSILFENCLTPGDGIVVLCWRFLDTVLRILGSPLAKPSEVTLRGCDGKLWFCGGKLWFCGGMLWLRGVRFRFCVCRPE